MKFYLIYFTVLFSIARCDIFTSFEEMTKLVQAEIDITKDLQNFLDHQSEKINEAKK